MLLRQGYLLLPNISVSTKAYIVFLCTQGRSKLYIEKESLVR